MQEEHTTEQATSPENITGLIKEKAPFEVAEGGFIHLIDTLSASLDMLVENDLDHPLSRCDQYKSVLSMSNFEATRWFGFIKQFRLTNSGHKHAFRCLDAYVDWVIESGRSYADPDVTDQDDVRICSALIKLIAFLTALHFAMSAQTNAKDRRKHTGQFCASVS
jgi:hypothetical protein